MKDLVRQDKGVITIDTNEIAQVEEQGKSFVLKPEAEDQLLRWLNFMDFVAEMDKNIRHKLGDAMEKENMRGIRGDAVTVSKAPHGPRYSVSDAEAAKDLEMAIKSERYTPNITEIERYFDDTGELPPGIKLNDRKESVTIKKVKEKPESLALEE